MRHAKHHRRMGLIPDDDGNFAMLYRCPQTREWYYIPTVPERRNWRGPFQNREIAEQEVIQEIGQRKEVTFNVTTIRPRCLD